MSDKDRSVRRTGVFMELILFAAALIILNIPLAGGKFAESMIFLPDRVMAGEWWRVLSHPFVHLTWYHLLLDAGAFLLLYNGIQEPKWHKRAGYVAACGIGSLIVSMAASPVAHARGLCGLSGIAHGLMAVSALESMTREDSTGKSRSAGVITFGIVVVKSILEVVSGHVFFESLHLGLMGIPIPESHAGGVLFGIVAFRMLHSCASGSPVYQERDSSPPAPPESRIYCRRNGPSDDQGRRFSCLHLLRDSLGQ